MISINTPFGLSNTSKKFNYSVQTKTEDYNDVKDSIDNNDMLVISKLNTLRVSLNQPQLNLNSIKQQIEAISTYNQTANYVYLNNLLRPEKAKGCKIPSQIPVPSCAFQLHNSITLTTNAQGNVAFFMNPCFLASETALGKYVIINDANYYISNFLTSAWVNNDASLAGNAPNSNWVPVNFGQTLPDVYEQCRLVSASLVVKYIGRLDMVSGYVGGAIFYEAVNAIGGKVQANNYNPQTVGTNTIATGLAKFANFDYAQDAFFSQTNSTLEGVRMLYFPIDNAYEEYRPVASGDEVNNTEDSEAGAIELTNAGTISGFNWFFYANGTVPSQPQFKVDIYCNFECLPSAKFLNYMPITLNPCFVTPDEKKKIRLFLHHRAIMKYGEDIFDEVAVPSIFGRMISKFKNGLPGFDILASWGLMNAVPGLKPGLALAGNMIQQSMQLDNC